MSRQCRDNVLSFVMAIADGHTSFSIVLPDEVIETMMDLKPSKMYGANRAEIAAQLIKDMLKQLSAQGLVRKWPAEPH